MGSGGPLPVELRIVDSESSATQELLARVFNYQDIPATLRGPEGEGILKEGCLTLKVPSAEIPSWELYKQCLEAKDAPRMLASGPMGEPHVIEWSDRLLGLLNICDKHRMPLMIMKVEFALFKRMARFIHAIGDSCEAANTGGGPSELTHTLSGFGYDKSSPENCVVAVMEWLEATVRLDLDPDLTVYFAGVLGFYSTLYWDGEMPFLDIILGRTVPMLAKYADTSPESVEALLGSMHSWKSLRRTSDGTESSTSGKLAEKLAEMLGAAIQAKGEGDSASE